MIPYTNKEVRQAYHEYRSIMKTAEALGISRSTVKRRLHGVPKQVGRPPVPMAMKKSWSTKVYTWFQEHETEPLPHSASELAKLSNFKSYQIAYFLKLRKQIFGEKASILPDLRHYDLRFIDVLGREFSTLYAISYTFGPFDPFDGSTTLRCLTGGGRLVTIKTSYKEVEEKLATSKKLD